jgi:hypothetical protein
MSADRIAQQNERGSGNLCGSHGVETNSRSIQAKGDVRSDKPSRSDRVTGWFLNAGLTFIGPAQTEPLPIIKGDRP